MISPEYAPAAVSALSAGIPSPTLESSEGHHKPQFLRVRRRRGAITATTLRLGLDVASAATDALANFDLGESSGSLKSPNGRQSPHFNPSTVVFRRIGTDDAPIPPFVNQEDASDGNKRRVVDAVLLEDDQTQSTLDSTTRRSSKRRRFTLRLIGPNDTEFNNSKNFDNNNNHNMSSSTGLSYPVLSPEERRVDDSLRDVFSGSISLLDHTTLLESLCPMQQQIYRNKTARTNDWVWSWCHVESGNLLHAAAMWDEAHVAGQVLSTLAAAAETFVALQESAATAYITPSATTRHNSSGNVVSDLLSGIDGDGRTPQGLALLLGHSRVSDVLDSMRVESHTDDDDDYEHFEYDLYCLDHPDESAQTTDTAGITPTTANDNDHILDCELHNHCTGYWNGGELVLEAPKETNGPFDTMLDQNDTDDEDSNDEQYVGNDYPDDDGDWSSGTNASSECALDNNRMQSQSALRSFDTDGEFDASYGVYGQDDGSFDKEC